MNNVTFELVVSFFRKNEYIKCCYWVGLRFDKSLQHSIEFCSNGLDQ